MVMSMSFLKRGSFIGRHLHEWQKIKHNYVFLKFISNKLLSSSKIFSEFVAFVGFLFLLFFAFTVYNLG